MISEYNHCTLIYKLQPFKCYNLENFGCFFCMLPSTAFIKSSLCIIAEFHKAWNYTIKSNNEQKFSQNQNKLRSDKTSHVTKQCYQQMLILNLSNHSKYIFMPFMPIFYWIQSLNFQTTRVKIICHDFISKVASIKKPYLAWLTCE